METIFCQPPSTLHIMSGDQDFLPPARKAVEKGWRLVFWSFQSALSGKVREFVCANPGKVQLEILDNCDLQYVHCKHLRARTLDPNIDLSGDLRHLSIRRF